MSLVSQLKRDRLGHPTSFLSVYPCNLQSGSDVPIILFICTGIYLYVYISIYQSPSILFIFKFIYASPHLYLSV